MSQENTDFVLEKSPPVPPDNTAQIKRVLEAVLLSATQPLTVSELRKVFETEIGADLVRTLLNELRAEWEMRPLELLPLKSVFSSGGQPPRKSRRVSCASQSPPR